MLLAALLALLALLAAGCVGDDDQGEEAVAGRPVPELAKTTEIRGGSPRERALLRRVAGGMQKTALTRIQIGQVKGRRMGDAGPAVPIFFTTVEGASVRRHWDEWIVAGAFSRRLDRAGLPAEVDASGRDGGFTARPRLRGQPDPRPLSAPQAAAVVKAIRTAARRSGAGEVTVEVHRPYGAAVVVTVAPQNPAGFLKTKLRSLLDRLSAQGGKLEGLYLAMLDERRRLALEWGSWTRNSAGSYWVRHDLAECSPIEQSEPPGTEKPPPCPA